MIVIIAWSELGIPVTFKTVGGYLGFLVISSMVAYSLFLLPQILSFWLMNTSAIAEVTDMFWDFNNMPMDIYNRMIREIGVFILPIFVISNFPPLFVLDRMPPIYLAWDVFGAPAPAHGGSPPVEQRPSELQQRQQLNEFLYLVQPEQPALPAALAVTGIIIFPHQEYNIPHGAKIQMALISLQEVSLGFGGPLLLDVESANRTRRDGSACWAATGWANPPCSS